MLSYERASRRRPRPTGNGMSQSEGAAGRGAAAAHRQHGDGREPAGLHRRHPRCCCIASTPGRPGRRTATASPVVQHCADERRAQRRCPARATWTGRCAGPATMGGITFTEQLARQWRQFTRPTASRTRAAYGLKRNPRHGHRHAARDAIRALTVSPCRATRSIVDPDTGAAAGRHRGRDHHPGLAGQLQGLLGQAEATAKTLPGRLGGRATWAAMRTGLPHLHQPLREMIRSPATACSPRRSKPSSSSTRRGPGAVIESPDAEKGEVVRLHREEAGAGGGSRRACGLVPREHGALQGAAQVRFIAQLRHGRGQGAAAHARDE